MAPIFGTHSCKTGNHGNGLHTIASQTELAHWWCRQWCVVALPFRGREQIVAGWKGVPCDACGGCKIYSFNFYDYNTPSSGRGLNNGTSWTKMFIGSRLVGLFRFFVRKELRDFQDSRFWFPKKEKTWEDLLYFLRSAGELCSISDRRKLGIVMQFVMAIHLSTGVRNRDFV